MQKIHRHQICFLDTEIPSFRAFHLHSACYLLIRQHAEHILPNALSQSFVFSVSKKRISLPMRNFTCNTGRGRNFRLVTASVKRQVSPSCTSRRSKKISAKRPRLQYRFQSQRSRSMIRRAPAIANKTAMAHRPHSSVGTGVFSAISRISASASPVAAKPPMKMSL